MRPGTICLPTYSVSTPAEPRPRWWPTKVRRSCALPSGPKREVVQNGNDNDNALKEQASELLHPVLRVGEEL